jgi:alcohol dehydrogenase (cytochrome c)
MHTRNGLITAALAATATIALCASAEAQSEPFAPTTTERLRNADSEPHNWLMNLGNYSNWQYSQLDQINKDNVGDLRVLYTVSIGGCAVPPGGDLSPNCNEQNVPLVENGIMYVADGMNRVMAFDVSSGDRAVPLWHFDPQTERLARDRGLALYDTNVIKTTGDARIVAVDKQSGELVWEVGSQEPIGEPNTADMVNDRDFTAAGVYGTAGGRDIIIPSHSGPGVGYVAAYDATDGELIWRTYTIPQPGDPNFGTWPGETWRTGRAAPWGPRPAYDPEINLLYVGTGEPSPVYDPEFRPGDNLYSVSTLALDADTGAIAWYFQEIPNDQTDGDSTSSRMLYPLDGRNVVGNWGRMGFFYQFDRATGEFINATAQVDNINWTAGIDPKTGHPVEYVPNAGLQTYAVTGPRRGRAAADAPSICAAHRGAPTGIWSAAYDPTSGITYQTRTIACMYYSILRPTEQQFNPLGGENLGGQSQVVLTDAVWALISIDTATGEVKRIVRDLGVPNDYQAEVGVLATAGGLLFTGAEDGRITAHDNQTLEEVWHFNTGTNLKGGIITFAVDGNQYLAKIIGGDGGASRTGHLPAAMLMVWGL